MAISKSEVEKALDKEGMLYVVDQIESSQDGVRMRVAGQWHDVASKSQAIAIAKKQLGLGEVRHRHWRHAPQASTAIGFRPRRLNVTIDVTRAAGSKKFGRAKVMPYKARACLAKAPQRFHLEAPGKRCGVERGKTPTQAVKNAMRQLLKEMK